MNLSLKPRGLLPFHEMIEHSRAGVCVIENGQFLYANPQMGETFGYTQKELTDLPSVYHLVANTDRDLVQGILSKCQDSTLPRNRLSFQGIKKEGEIIDIEAHAFCTSLDGRSAVLGTLLDITEQTRSVEALPLSELEYRQLVDSIQVIVWRRDARTFSRFSFVNRQAEVLLGHPISCWTQDPKFWEEHVFQEDLEMVFAAYREAVASLVSQAIEYRMIAADGRIVWLHDNIHVVKENNRVSGLIGVMADITARKNAEISLRESQVRLESIINSAMDAIITIDDNQQIMIFNRSAEKIFGCSTAEAVGQPIKRFIAESHHADYWQHFIQFGKDTTTLSERDTLWAITGLRANGEEFPMEASISQAKVPGQKIYTLILRDISERKQGEEALFRTRQQLLHSQKMEAIGRLAGAVAHDFNNMLTGILGYTDIAMSSLDHSSPLYFELEQIRMTSELAADLTRQLLAFSRRQILQPRILSLNSIIKESTKLLERLIGKDVELVVILDPDLASIKADSSQIEQVIMNLAVNACDAMPHGGKLKIETSNIVLDKDFVNQHLSTSPGPHVLLSVSDNGTGMDLETQARIFEPFFTTKEKGKGTGLGLSTVYGIIRQNGGDVWVSSELGRGTTFNIYLPSVNAPAEIPNNPISPKESPGGTETILLMEDDETVRKLTSRVLKLNGYRVLEATTGKEAIQICEREKHAIQLLISSLTMPWMRGDELAERLHQYCPGMKSLYLFGHTEQTVVQNDATMDVNFNFLPKPFTPRTLTQRVRKILDSREESE